MESYISVVVFMAWKILYSCELSLMLIALRIYCILLHDIAVSILSSLKAKR